MERETGRSPEAAKPYLGIGNGDLMDMFYATDCEDELIGQELVVRMFEHAKLPDDPATMPLIGGDGQQIGRLMQIDYVNFAVKRHLEHVPGILDFLKTKPGDQAYEDKRATMLERLHPGAS